MNELKVYFLMGDADCNDPNIHAYSDRFLLELSDASGFKIVCAPIEEVADQVLPVFFIASGGAEEGFKAAYLKARQP